MDASMENIPAQKTQKIKTTKGSIFFHKIAFLLLDDDAKNDVAKEIIEEGTFGKVYRLQLILSSIICTLGLLINSIPVIIGAMLIAPILLPIKALAFSITTGNRHMYYKGLKFASLSIILSIGTAAIVGYFTPLATLTPEIMARTSPTLIDLFIALASGIIAFISLGYKKLRENLAGVAMATALVPPLCVTGIGITFLNIGIAEGSILLFITNFIAIILIGIIIFFAFGFFPKNHKGKERSISTIIITIILVITISFPLTNSMKEIANDIQTTQIIQQTSNDFLKGIDENIDLESLNYQNIDIDKIRIRATINVPNTTTITQQHKDNLSKILAASIQKSVELDLNIVIISSVYIEQEKKPSQEELVQEVVKLQLKAYTGVIVIETKTMQYNNARLLYINLFSEIQQNEEEIQKKMEKVLL